MNVPLASKKISHLDLAILASFTDKNLDMFPEYWQ